MKVQREFALRPPHEPLTSLEALTRDWKWRTAPGGGLDLKRDAVVDYCREAKSNYQAVMRACISRDATGKMHNHQSKVREDARLELGRLILACNNVRRIRDFDKLHDHIEAIKPWGIGPVTVYDVAVRIGAYTGVEPQSLYLHAGVLEGWVALVPSIEVWARMKRLGRSWWPMEVKGWKADELEDFLCTYRELFPKIRKAGWRVHWE